jgi:tetratricopeptide (TPR) repeat protein
MKNILLFIFAILVFKAIGQNNIEIISKANNLIDLKKYESAYNLLDKYDSTNINLDIVLLKTDILLKYFTSSLSHRLFSLKDIEENENILDYRGRGGIFGGIFFPVDSILNNLKITNSKNCKLHKYLGDYYFDANLRFGSNWFLDIDRQYLLIEENYLKAVEGDCADELSYYALGLINLNNEKADSSISYFKKVLELNFNSAAAHFNLGYIYSNSKNNFKEAIEYFKNALNFYADNENKFNSATFLADTYSKFNDFKNAIKYYELANEISPNNDYIFNKLMDFYLKSDSNKSDSMANDYFNLAPNNIEMYYLINEVFKRNEKENRLRLFYENQLLNFGKNEEVLGYLNYILGVEYIEIDKKNAKSYLINSRLNFNRFFENKKIVGIGAQLKVVNDDIIVTKIISGSASEKQGELEIDDIILSVGQGNEKPVIVNGLNIDEVLPLIRGKKGTEVRLTVEKLNSEIKTISILRDLISNEDSLKLSEEESVIIDNINEALKKCGN